MLETHESVIHAIQSGGPGRAWLGRRQVPSWHAFGEAIGQVNITAVSEFRMTMTIIIVKTRCGKTIRVAMMANPSHLEAVDPVIVGRIRAEQVAKGDLASTTICSQESLIKKIQKKQY